MKKPKNFVCDIRCDDNNIQKFLEKLALENFGAEQASMRRQNVSLSVKRFFALLYKLLRENIVIILVVYSYLSNDIPCNISLNYSQ